MSDKELYEKLVKSDDYRVISSRTYQVRDLRREVSTFVSSGKKYQAIWCQGSTNSFHVIEQ